MRGVPESDPSKYLSVTVPCYPEVRCYLEHTFPKCGDLTVLNARTSLGKVIVSMLIGKRSRITPSMASVEYPDSIDLAVSPETMRSRGYSINPKKVSEINNFVKGLTRDLLYHHIQIQLTLDPNYHIHNGIVVWMHAMGITEDVKSVDSYKRSFLNWRKRNFPELVRPVGAPSNNLSDFFPLSKRAS